MKRMWRVAWTDGQTSHVADYPKRRQAQAHAARLRWMRGDKGTPELVYWVRVWA